MVTLGEAVTSGPDAVLSPVAGDHENEVQLGSLEVAASRSTEPVLHHEVGPLGVIFNAGAGVTVAVAMLGAEKHPAVPLNADTDQL